MCGPTSRMGTSLPPSIAQRIRRLGAGLVALALVAAAGPGAGADTQSRLSSAEQKLSHLRSARQRVLARLSPEENLFCRAGDLNAGSRDRLQVDKAVSNIRPTPSA